MGLILFALDYPPAHGGIQRYCHELARALVRRGEKLLVIASAQPDAEQFDAAQPFPTLRVRNQGKTQAALALREATLRALRENLLGEPAELILCGKWFPEGAAALLLKRQTGLPYVFLGHGREITLTGMNLAKWLMQRSIARGAAGALVNSRYTAGQVQRRGVPADRARLIYAGVNPEEFVVAPDRVAALRDQLGLEREKVLLTVSRLVSRKGQDQVLRALPAVRERVGAVRYLVVGGGPEESRLRELADRLGLTEQVSFLSRVGDGDLPALYALADVLVMPSRDLPGEPIEGFGLVYLEANLCGTAVVGGRTGGTEDAIVDGETGLLVDPEQPEEIGEALVRLLTESDLARQLAETGGQRAREEFTWDHVAERAAQALRDWGLRHPAEGVPGYAG